MTVAIVTHGGAGSPPEWSGGCQEAAARGFQQLLDGRPALAAAVEAVRMMEDDGRFNAGYGSALRLDGKSVEMDAAVMGSDGLLGAVAIIAGVKNPVLVAAEVARSPHHVLAGAGAGAFARKRGFPEWHEVSRHARERYEAILDTLSRRKENLLRQWGMANLEELWNFDTPVDLIFPSDTVGAVARDREGRFAVATSTGGSGTMLLGRVGDTPLIGSGFYAGEAGAVATTGIGEEIMKHLLAKAVYDDLSRGVPPREACARGVALFPPDVPIGAIAVSMSSAGSHANTRMACAILPVTPNGYTPFTIR